MKPITGLTCFFLIFSIPVSLTGQWRYEDDITVPSSVLKEFQKHYPQARQLSWTKDSGLYKANFLLDEYLSDATFLETGQWLETGTMVDERILPTPILEKVQRTYRDFDFFDLIIRKDTPQTTFWEVRFFYEEEEVILLFTRDGELLTNKQKPGN